MLLLRDLFRQLQSRRFGTDPDAELVAKARTLYAQVTDAEERRRAYWAFARERAIVADEPPAAVPATFTLGDAPDLLRVDGYDSGERWNGWAVPLLPREGVVAFVERMMASDGYSCCAGWKIVFNGDALEERHDPSCCDSSTTEPSWVLTEDGPRLLWRMAAGFTWELAADTDH